MDVYSVIKEFSAPQLGVHVGLTDTVSKLSGRVAAKVNASEYECKAFYDWIGSADSLNYLLYTGTVPDGDWTVGGGSYGLTAGQDYYQVTGAGFGWVPTAVVCTVGKPGASDSNIFATVRDGSLTVDGFDVDFSADIPGAGYILYFVVFQ